jgi:hypothetical protein
MPLFRQRDDTGGFLGQRVLEFLQFIALDREIGPSSFRFRFQLDEAHQPCAVAYPDRASANSACGCSPNWGKAERGEWTKEAAIAIVAAPFGLAFVAWLAALIAGRVGGLIRLVAQALAVVLFSVAGALAGFLIPLAPLPDTGINPALIAGALGTLGTVAGMAVAEWLLARLDRRAD